MKKLLQVFALFLAVCLVMATVPAAGAESKTGEATVEQASDNVTVVVAACDIPVGTRVSDKHLRSVTVKNVNMPTNTISDPLEIVGQYLGEPIGEGEYFRQAALFKKQIAPLDRDLLLKELGPSTDKYVSVTDYVQADTGKDVTGILQSIIDENPQRTIYFPDGEYLISQSLLTSGLEVERVCIELSDGAVIRATESFCSVDGNRALICMGGTHLSNSGNSMISGGVLDGRGVADGISIDSCLDSYVRNVCIINANVGIDVKLGIHNKSSCWDITNVTVIGNGTVGSIGMKVTGYDNTITDIRIYNMHTGLSVTGAGNFFKGISIVNSVEDKGFCAGSVGVNDTANNWYTNCYVENCATAYAVASNALFWDNAAVWTNGACGSQTALKLSGGIIPIIGFRAEFFGEDADTEFMALPEGQRAVAAVLGGMTNAREEERLELSEYLLTDFVALDGTEDN